MNGLDMAAEVRFDAEGFLAAAGLGRRIVFLKARQAFFAQGAPADSIFYLQSGRARLTVVSEKGKEATIALVTRGEFVGEESIGGGGNGAALARKATAVAVTPCAALRIDREEMLRMLATEPAFAKFFMRFLLARCVRLQADMVDQLFHSGERRLARILLLMTDPEHPDRPIPSITQQTLAEIIGTTRSRVSMFMNRFRRLGFIEYNGRIVVHESRLHAVLADDAKAKG